MTIDTTDDVLGVFYKAIREALNAGRPPVAVQLTRAAFKALIIEIDIMVALNPSEARIEEHIGTGELRYLGVPITVVLGAADGPTFH